MSSSTSEPVTNVAVIIRSVGERTEALCTHLVKQQVPESHVVVIHERPFSQAVRRSFEIGLDFGLDWTLCVDADLLVRDNAINRLVTSIEWNNESALGGNGCLIDKLMGYKRNAGPHLYRTFLLEEALNLIPSSEVTLRPEAYLHAVMAERRHPWIQIKDTLSLHAYEQYYRDIYRVMVVRTQKSKYRVVKLMRRAKDYSHIDKDFLVTLWGLRVGLVTSESSIRLDAEQWKDDFNLLLTANALDEKTALSPDHVPINPNRIVRNYERARYPWGKEIALMDRPLRPDTWVRALLVYGVERLRNGLVAPAEAT